MDKFQKDKYLILTREELNNLIDSALKRCAHDVPSKATLDMFKTINDALFGPQDDEGHREGGMVDKTDEMYKLFIIGKSGSILLKLVAGFIITTALVIGAVKGFLK